MQNESLLPDEIIQSKIYLLREQKVMLDRDLADLYKVETKYLKRKVRRNIERFPEDFMFELDKEELQNWRSQFGSSNSSENMGLRYAPFAFTEQGVAMLSNVLNSPTAISINIQIIRVFTKMRELLADTIILKQEVEEIKKNLSNQGKNIELVFNYLDELIQKKEKPKPRAKIGYNKVD
ncbi:MAG: ORF6N domain-containing protein [Maribacter sp.]